MKETAMASGTISNIKSSLKYSLEHKYGNKDPQVVEELLKIHGLHDNNFNVIKNVELLVTEKINDNSIDDNSNKNEKTIEGIQQEAFAPFRKAIGYDFLYRKLREIYGREEAKRLCGEMFDFSLGLSDTTHILKPYCWAFNASNLVIEGRNFGQLHSKPCKRVESYISALCETIHQMSSHLAGAIAIGTFFLDIAHILLYREKVDLYRLKNDQSKRKKIENELQQFVHSVNHLSRNGCESPFTNVSIFDKIKLRTMITDMDFYFPEEELPIAYNQPIENDEKRKEYIMNYLIEYVSELQDIYVEFFNKGDPQRNGLPYRFPVTTMNLAKTEKQETYEVTFDNETTTKIKKGKVVDAKKDNQIEEKLAIETLFQVNDQRIYFMKESEGKYSKIKNITKKQGAELIDLDFLRKCCKLDIYRYNIFCSAGTKVASCCRLLSDKDMLDYASQTNSFGGSGVSLGSHRVCTINFMRLALEAESKENFYKRLDERIESAAKILKAHKQLIIDLAEGGLQMFIKMGWIDMARMFSTFGLLGLYEASAELERKFGNGYDIEGEILRYINNKIAELAGKYQLIFNIEQIPGESFAVRLCNADKLIYGETLVPYKMYANQFIPLWQDATLWEKMDEDGKYNQLITGGGIVHAQIGEKVTGKQAEKIIRYAVNSGCEHFALNAVYCICEKEHVNFGKLDVCPICNAKIKDYLTRVVGFFTPVSSWNKTRREWEFPRRKFVDLKKIDEAK